MKMDTRKKEYPYLAELGHLPSKEIIASVFRVGRETVEEWFNEGAPIAVEGEGFNRRYSANYHALQNWRVNRFKIEENAI